jgi:hypothetical protein
LILRVFLIDLRCALVQGQRTRGPDAHEGQTTGDPSQWDGRECRILDRGHGVRGYKWVLPSDHVRARGSCLPLNGTRHLYPERSSAVPVCPIGAELADPPEYQSGSGQCRPLGVGLAFHLGVAAGSDALLRACSRGRRCSVYSTTSGRVRANPPLTGQGSARIAKSNGELTLNDLTAPSIPAVPASANMGFQGTPRRR